MNNIKEEIENNEIVMIKKNNCKNCKKLYDLLVSFSIENIHLINISEFDEENFDEIIDFIEEINLTREMPMLFINNEYIGNYEKIKSINEFGLFSKLLEKKLNKVIYEEDNEDF